MTEVLRWRIDLEPWANGMPALQEEAQRFLSYISTPQVSCDAHREDYGPWALCLDQRFSLAQRIRSKHCRVYSLRLGSSSADVVERALASSGCDVHCFDPSISSAHLQQQQHLWLHRLSVDWRDPNPAVPPHRAHSNSRKLKNILNHFGHRQIAHERTSHLFCRPDITAEAEKSSKTAALMHESISDA
ncbi:probable methyltransferase-like protein 24 isoform X5 [Danio rerio]|uniref:Probable methyltransferase-like protein 24 isoform X5 n=1 Tax=Danio rerio TaxID=7955 RepID=A0AC58I6T9_DANRE